MDRLPTRVNRVDPDYQNRRTHNLELIETFAQDLMQLAKAAVANTLRDTAVEENAGP